jgi:hypothetical protein
MRRVQFAKLGAAGEARFQWISEELAGLTG